MSLMMQTQTKKPQIKQKTTWTALGLFGWAIYNFIQGNFAEGSTAAMTAIGLLFAGDN